MAVRKKSTSLAKKKTNFILPEGAVKASMPGMIKPMKARLVDEPFDDPQWIFEMKWDGFRALANIKDGKVNLYSRNALSFERYTSVVEAFEGFQHDVILDGEIVAFDENENPRFQLLQNYQRLEKVNIRYCVFDIIYFNGYDLKKVPLIERKKLLKEVLQDLPETIFYSGHIIGEGRKFYHSIEKKGMEGIMAKKADSLYEIDERSDFWLKIKTEKRQEVIICGYTEPKGSRQYFGALVLGVYENGKLDWVGNSGTGFDLDSLEAVYETLQPYKQKKCPFNEKIPHPEKITWLKPKVVCEIAFGEWTDDGTMRHPVFQGLREDKDPKKVIREREGNAHQAVEKAEKES